MSATQNSPAPHKPTHVEAIVVGAGFAGIRMLVELRRIGISALALESAADVGGTWYWNRYPGARTDSEAWTYALPLPEVEQEWTWTERYPAQEEVQRYIAFVADRMDVRRDIHVNQRVTSAVYDEESNLWTIKTESGDTFTSTYFMPALGHLSVANDPQFAGAESFAGAIYQTSKWPHEKIDFTGKRVAVVGTGSSGVQVIPLIAKEAEHLTVFQRTPNYIMPAQNQPLDEKFQRNLRENRAIHWDKARSHFFGFAMDPAGRCYDDVTSEEDRERIFEEGWQKGGFRFVFETFDDIVLDQRSNDAASEFIRKKIRETVKDPATAELLTPRDHPYVSKRPPTGIDYYETFNRDNVTLVDVKAAPIEALTPTGLRTSLEEYECDVIVLATGFDVATGSYARLDIRGRDGLKLSDAWAGGPETYLGVSTPGFPNMLMVCGPQTPYINHPIAVEMVVSWLGRMLEWLRDNDYDRVEATPDVTAQWSEMVEQIFASTLLSAGEAANSWYVGANIPGKPRRALFYFGGGAGYSEVAREVADNGYWGFNFSKVVKVGQRDSTDRPAAPNAVAARA
jgi:cation diffusion facilitator CzcD-associated flavoprotein CzcO